MSLQLGDMILSDMTLLKSQPTPPLPSPLSMCDITGLEAVK
jgi:hypothetical protein